MDYAGYLASQVEEERLDDEDDAALGQRATDPVKAAIYKLQTISTHDVTLREPTTEAIFGWELIQWGRR